MFYTCLSFCPQIDTHPPPWQTPPPPGQTPQCMLGYTPPAKCMLGYGQQAGGTHLTGMHSCIRVVNGRTEIAEDCTPTSGKSWLQRIRPQHSFTFCHQQWRIQDFPEVGTPTLQDGAPTYDFAKLSQKLHEIKRIRPPGGVQNFTK